MLPTPPTEPTVASASDATVLILTPFHPASEVEAEKRFGRVVRPGQGGMSVEACLAVCDAVLLRIGDMTGDMIRAAPRLRMIARNGTGVDAIDLDACRERGVVVTNVPGGNAKAVAELVLALTLSVLRRVVEVHNRITSGERVPSLTALSHTLFGKTVGLIGMGDIAYESAHLFAAFGCTILVHSPRSPTSRWVDPVSEGGRYPRPLAHERVGMDELLARADVVSVHCPLLPETRGLLGDEEFKKMKKTAIVVNSARGGIVDEKALVKALKEGEMYGAGLDVFEKEPAYGENLGELGKWPTVVCLPHLGGSTDESTFAGCMKAIHSATDFLNGLPVGSRVV